MKKNYLITQFEKVGKKKKTWKSLLGNLLVSNFIAAMVGLVKYNYGEKVDWKLDFLVNNTIGLIVWAFNLFYPW